MYYVVIKVALDKVTESDNIGIVSIFHCLSDAKKYIKNMNHITIDSKLIAIHRTDSIPTEQDPDGYFIVTNKSIKNRYDIYHKNTQILPGYVYNSASISINKQSFYQIIEYSDCDGDYKYQFYNCQKFKKVKKENNEIIEKTNTQTFIFDKEQLLNELQLKIEEFQNRKEK